jgi:DNA-binding CsgD family transcriptional regulator
MAFVGAAGIGKSTLLDEIAFDAIAQGFAVRRVNGTPSEQGLPFAGLNALLSHDLADDDLDPVLAASIGVAPIEVPPLPQAVAASLVGHLSEKSETQPLLVIVDDLQWIDPSTINVLGLLVSSIGADRFALIFGVRTGAARAEETPTNETWNPARIVNAADISSADASLGWIDHANPIVLHPLSDDESLSLLIETGINVSEARLIADIAGGLPLALVELARNGHAQGATATTTRFVDMARLYARRLEQLPADVRRIAQLCAIESNLEAVQTVFGEGYQAAFASAVAHEILRDPLLDADGPHLRSASSPATGSFSNRQAGLGTLDAYGPHLRSASSPASGSLEFAHPLLRIAAIGATSAPQQRSLHRQFADVLANLQPELHSDRVAIHRGAAALGPDDEAADLLVAFAVRAKGQGALVESSQGLLRAAELTTDPMIRSRRMLNGAETLYFGGDARRAMEIIDREIPRILDPGLLGDAEFLYARVAEWEQPSTNTVAILRRLARRFEESEPIRSAWALGMASSMAMMAGDLCTGIDDARRSLELAEANNEFFAAIVAKGNLVWNLFLRGERGEAEEAVGSIAALMKMAAETETVEGIMVAQGLAMMSVINEDWENADTILTQSLGLSRKMGVKLSTILLSMIRGNLLWRLGRWDEAALLANQNLNPQGLPAISYTWGSAESANMAASRGDETNVERILAESLPEAERLGLPLVEAWLRTARAHLALSKANPTAAIVDLDIVRSLTERMGLVEPGFFLWQGDWLSSLIAVGRIDDARNGIARAKIVATSTGRRWLKGVIARAEAELAIHDTFDPSDARDTFGAFDNFDRAITRDGDLALSDASSPTKTSFPTGEPDRGLQSAIAGFDASLGWFTELAMPFEIARTHLTRAQVIERSFSQTRSHIRSEVARDPGSDQEPSVRPNQEPGPHSSPQRAIQPRYVRAQLEFQSDDDEPTTIELDQLLFHDLDRASHIFGHLGATLWGKQTADLRIQATERLSVASAPTPISEAKPALRIAEQLTTAELRVAVCVAEGRTNREAAQELHVSSKTVEYHLQAIYRKLGVNNRSACTAKVIKARAMELSN